jgi:tripartite-type tricarboxylate transporter receptor subunit TctC
VLPRTPRRKPTVAEAGVLGDTHSIWLGIMAPAGTPDAVVQRLNEAITRIATAEETRAV